jgi:hypothetical protein
MRILLIGNFAPPYEEESLYNFSLLNRLMDEGNDCCAINISAKPAKKEGIHDISSYIDYILKLIRFARKRDIIHFSTKGYTRLGLLKFALSTLAGWLYRAKPVVTFHSELLSIIGLTRSPFGGQQTINFSFSRAHKIIFTDKDTYDIASPYKTKDNFTLMPSFISVPGDIETADILSLKKLKERKRIVVFSNVTYPSFLFEILKSFIANTPDSDIGMAVSLSEKPSAKLQHAIAEIGKEWINNMTFIESDDLYALLSAYSKADVILKTLSCDGKPFFSNFAVSLKKPARSKGYLYFPDSLLLLKEGETADMCADIIKDVLLKEAEPPSGHAEDFYSKLKGIYTG